MSTLDRLRQLVRSGGAGKPESAAAKAESAGGKGESGGGQEQSAQPPQPVRELTYEAVDESGMPMPARPEVPSLPGASMLDTPAGRCIVIDRMFEAESSHGLFSVEHASVTSADVIAFCE